MTRIIFMGTPDFAVSSLKMLLQEGYDVVGVVTQPDRPKGRKKVVTPTPVKALAQEHQIPVFQPKKLREPEEVKKVIYLKPDLIITAAYGQILPKAILDAPKYGCINVHASLLPKYRGGAPIHWAIINGEKETGITIMYMVKALDAGDILSQRAIPITNEDTTGTMHEKLSELGAELLKETLPSVLKEEVSPIPQNEEHVTYASNITRQDEKIDWSRPATEIYNHVRGLHPWPVAYTTWRKDPFKVWWVEVIDEESALSPGTVIEVKKEGIIISTGSGKLLLKDVQPAGKKRLPIEEFVRGDQMKKGERLGE